MYESTLARSSDSSMYSSGVWATWTTDDSSYTETQVTEYYQSNTGLGLVPAPLCAARLKEHSPPQ
jgi:hypothetical protein